MMGGTHGRARRRVLRLALTLLAGFANRAIAQEPLAAIPHSHMRTVLEKTFLKVDVLALDVCVDPVTARRIAAFTASPRTRPLEDSIARAVIDADSVTGRIRFLRNVSYSQFIGGILDEQKHAVDAGLLADSTHRNVSASLPEWFSFLENRDIRENEQVIYRIRGDSVRTTYVDLAGERLLDRVDTGLWRRTSVLATWYAPGSGFRKGLMQSAWDPAGPAGSCEPSSPDSR